MMGDVCIFMAKLLTINIKIELIKISLLPKICTTGTCYISK